MTISVTTHQAAFPKLSVQLVYHKKGRLEALGHHIIIKLLFVAPIQLMKGMRASDTPPPTPPHPPHPPPTRPTYTLSLQPYTPEIMLRNDGQIEEFDAATEAS